jgi:hypothetical protein
MVPILPRGGHSSAQHGDVNGEEKRKVENLFRRGKRKWCAKFFTSYEEFMRAGCASFCGPKAKTFNTENIEGTEKNMEEKTFPVFLCVSAVS